MNGEGEMDVIKALEKMASVFGAIVGVFIITRLFYWIIYKLLCRKKIDKKEGVVCSSLVSLIFIFVVKNPHLVIDDPHFLYVYFPCLILWLVYDLFRVR